MFNIFIELYSFFGKHKLWFILSLLLLLLLIGFGISRVQFEEDVRALIPQDDRIDEISKLIGNSKQADRIIVNFTYNDSLLSKPDSLIHYAEQLVASLQADTAYVKHVVFKMGNESMKDIYDFFYKNLPLYLTDDDYHKIADKLPADSLRKTIKKNFQSLISPAGIATKKYILNDPLSITPIALNRLHDFKLDDSFVIYGSCIFSKDLKNLLVFVEPVYSASNTQKSKNLIANLDEDIDEISRLNEGLSVGYYGGTAVAVANADRIKKDIQLTVSIVTVLIILLFFIVFRKVRVLLLLFLPVIIGAGVAIIVMSVFFGKISSIALGVGAILVGISIDYSLHAFTHYRNCGSVRKTLKDISFPVFISSFTTASAFLCLLVIKSKALNQLGVFGALSVMFAALSVLIILPHFLKGKSQKNADKTSKSSFLDNLAAYQIHNNKIVVIGLVVFSILFSFFVKNISFNSDISSLNYMPAHLVKAEKKLESISSETYSSVFVIHQGETMEEVLQNAEKTARKLQMLGDTAQAFSYSSVSDLMMSKRVQKEKVEKWNSFWDSVGRNDLIEDVVAMGSEFGFKEKSFEPLRDLINKDYETIENEQFNLLKTAFLSNYIVEDSGHVSLATMVKVPSNDKKGFFQLFEADDSVVIFDKEYFSNKFFDVLRDDFDKLVVLSFIIVFVILLVAYGRIELALITIFPISLSWIWTLGLMGLFHIQFNIFNIIISTFIFGLGIDYSVFIMRGLLNNYKYGKHALTPYKLSVLLSVITTILGLGVLIFAKHPALKSIAFVSIFGIVSVVIISFTTLPLLFEFFTSRKGKTKDRPFTMANIVISVVTFLLFLALSLTLTLVIPLLYLLPFPKKWKKYFFHKTIQTTSKIIVYLNVTIRKNYIGFETIDFSKPCVLLSNHQSHLDLVLLLLLHPKIIAVTNKWVWNNPFYGFVIRYADYIPIYKGFEHGFDRLKEKVSEGYSVLIFAEGSRTPDGEIKRYHQGGFKLADDLGLNIQPIIIHGAFNCMPKTEFFLRSGTITVKALPTVKVDKIDVSKGETYRFQAKKLNKLVRAEYELLRNHKEDAAFYKPYVISKYIFKGPVLEWYVKTKLFLESNYQFLDDIVPAKCKIFDIGCGFGYADLMLALSSPDREILGIDYDTEKISVAQRVASDVENLNFSVLDISNEDIPFADVYILSDVLHYLPDELQENVLKKCIKTMPKNGILIIRDADADMVEETKIIKRSEMQSTKLFRFNKTKYALSFPSGTKIKELAHSLSCSYSKYDNAKRTKNVYYVIRHEE